MTDFKDNFVKLLPGILTIILTILLVGGGFFISISENSAKINAEIKTIQRDITYLRQDIERLDDKKVNKELFEQVMKELQRMNDKLDNLRQRKTDN